MDVHDTGESTRWRDTFSDVAWALGRRMEAYKPLAEEVGREVLASERVQSELRRAAETRSAPQREVEAQARRMMRGMFADPWPNEVRAIAYVFRKAWRQMYEGIFVNAEGIEQLRRLTSSGVPIALLPTHKSHMDYLILTYLCFAHDLPLPYVVAGDNLNFPLVGPILSHGGAFFIRRQFGDDALYRAIFSEYVAALLRRGAMVECFVEGGRSRSGKVLPPKPGFLSVLCEAVAGDRVSDVHMVPVAVSYDKVIEGSSYVNEMLGAKKQKENLRDFLNAANSTLRLNFGSIDVHIQPAISLRSLFAPNAWVRHRFADDATRFLRAVGSLVLYQCSLGTCVTGTSLVAAVLLTTLNRGIHTREVVARVDWLRREVTKRGGRLARLFEHEATPAVVERALTALGKLVHRQNHVVYGFKHRESLELGYYRNQILHFFVAECIVALAVAAEIDNHAELLTAAGVPPSVDRERLLESSRFLSQLLKLEFVYPPGARFEATVDATVEAMKRRGVLAPSASIVAPALLPTSPSSSSSSSSPSSSGGQHVTVDRAQGRDMFRFLCMLLWPFVDVYWITVSALVALRPDRLVDEQALAKLVSQRAEALYYSGFVDFFEVVSVDAIKTAIAWCLGQGVLVVRRVETGGARAKGERLLQLAPRFQSAGPVRRSRRRPRAAPPPAAPAVAARGQRSFVHELLEAEADGDEEGEEDELERLVADEGMAAPPPRRGEEEERRADPLLRLAQLIGRFRKVPMARRDPGSVLRHYGGEFAQLLAPQARL